MAIRGNIYSRLLDTRNKRFNSYFFSTRNVIKYFYSGGLSASSVVYERLLLVLLSKVLKELITRGSLILVVLILIVRYSRRFNKVTLYIVIILIRLRRVVVVFVAIRGFIYIEAFGRRTLRVRGITSVSILTLEVFLYILILNFYLIDTLRSRRESILVLLILVLISILVLIITSIRPERLPVLL